MNTEISRTLLDWYAANARRLPWRGHPDAYAVWVSEIMLQQTRVETVIPYFERWMVRFPTIPALAKASQQEVLQTWEGLGYYSRARNLQQAAQKLVIGVWRCPAPIPQGAGKAARNRALHRRGDCLDGLRAGRGRPGWQHPAGTEPAVCHAPASPLARRAKNACGDWRRKTCLPAGPGTSTRR